MSVDLANVNISFEDSLRAYEELYQREDADPLDVAKARLDLVKYAQESVESKASAKAIYWYGSCRVTGDEGFPVNIQEGIGHLNEAVMMRSADALVILGDIYSGQIGTVPEDMIDFDKAVKNYERASEMGDGIASFRLAEIYSGASPIERDLRKALDYVEKSAIQQKCTEGIILMGSWIFFGELMHQNFDKAYEMLKPVVDEHTVNGEFKPKGLAECHAYTLVGIMTFIGEGAAPNEELGYNMIEDSASFGEETAILWLEDYQATGGY